MLLRFSRWFGLPSANDSTLTSCSFHLPVFFICRPSSVSRKQFISAVASLSRFRRTPKKVMYLLLIDTKYLEHCEWHENFTRFEVIFFQLSEDRDPWKFRLTEEKQTKNAEWVELPGFRARQLSYNTRTFTYFFSQHHRPIIGLTQDCFRFVSFFSFCLWLVFSFFC